jgi:hypothetical protein
MKEMEIKRIRIKELELICAELSEEIRHLSGQLRNINFIQRQDDNLKRRLSMSYMRANSMKEGNDLSSPVFKNQLKGALVDKTPEGAFGHEEGFSLAKDIALNRSSTTRRTTTRDSTMNERPSEGIKREKQRISDMFQTGEYFQDKFRKDLEVIEEDEDNKSSMVMARGSELSDRSSVIPEKPSDRGDSIFQKSASTVKAEEQEKKGEVGIGTEPHEEKGRKTEIISEATKRLIAKFALKIKEQNRRISEVLGTAGIDTRPSKIKTFDFLTLKKDEKIAKIQSSFNESNSGIVFSDYIYIINNTKEDTEKVKRILFINEYTIYVLNAKSYQVVQSTPINDLSIFIIVKTSGTLVAFHFEKA